MIHLYLVRHGIAEDAAAGVPDLLRTLTEKARRRFRKTARSFGRKSGALDLILASPLVRAVQTAEILAGEVKHSALGVLPELSPEHAPDALLKAVSRRARKSGSIALVGHEPQLSKLVAALAQLPAAQAAKLDIRPGAVVRVDVEALPQKKKAEARWWVRSGGRHKGLPWNKDEARAQKKRVAAARTKKKTAAAAKPGKEARRPSKPKASKPGTPVKSAPKAGPQKFMGSPRPAAPASAAPAASPPTALEPPDTSE
jgi:phosphohistidine phosphatase